MTKNSEKDNILVHTHIKKKHRKMFNLLKERLKGHTFMWNKEMLK